MKLLEYVKLFPKIINYKLSRKNIVRLGKPITVTYSITNKCNSKCKTCYIWQHTNTGKELDLKEIEKIFKSIGKIFYFNISGGEPFLREDLPKIIELACKYLKPGVIHTPTNAILSDLIIKKIREVLEIMRSNGFSDTPFTIKPSFDGIGRDHDAIRGIKGNFEKLLKTIKGLKELQKEYKNLHIGAGTVISKFNIKKIPEITEYVKTLNLDSYIHEIAENRSELFNINENITPDLDDYKNAVNYFIDKTKKEAKCKNKLSKIIYAFRIVYYRLVIKILEKKTQVIPCYAGLSNIHITPTGDVWPCCVLGYEKSMGNFRNVNYDFDAIINSYRAKQIKEFIRKKLCYCPLANQAYSNLLCNFASSVKIAKEFIFMLFQ